VVTALYNEIDRYCCDWLSNLMDAGEITPGKIDDRSIRDLGPDDVRGYERVHFFAGIGGWDVALDLAGWGTRPVWTGSCPCQPFSKAGRGKAADDERHLWPAWFSLIAQCRPPVVFGEQVETFARGWIDLVFTDLETEGYACAQAVLPAAGVGAPHIRHRTYWVGDACAPRLPTRQPALVSGPVRQHEGRAAEQSGCPSWADCDWLACTDGKARPVEPGTFPLAHGVRARVGKLRAYGNAIVPQVAAAFIGAATDGR